jgi:hypothetical protein
MAGHPFAAILNHDGARSSRADTPREGTTSLLAGDPSERIDLLLTIATTEDTS